MGLFFRKSFKLGPLRLNLSKSGLGASIGVKGARVGVDAKGKGYVAGGRGGIYFRERIPLSGATPKTHDEGTPPSPRSSGLLWIIIIAVALALVMTSAILGRM
jgi:hypothetical protein